MGSLAEDAKNCFEFTVTAMTLKSQGLLEGLTAKAVLTGQEQVAARTVGDMSQERTHTV
jgi:hypothetical protein